MTFIAGSAFSNDRHLMLPAIAFSSFFRLKFFAVFARLARFHTFALFFALS